MPTSKENILEVFLSIKKEKILSLKYKFINKFFILHASKTLFYETIFCFEKRILLTTLVNNESVPNLCRLHLLLWRLLHQTLESSYHCYVLILRIFLAYSEWKVSHFTKTKLRSHNLHIYSTYLRLSSQTYTYSTITYFRSLEGNILILLINPKNKFFQLQITIRDFLKTYDENVTLINQLGDSAISGHTQLLIIN